ncbi:hypothetical protein [Alcaligenes sp. SORT26]|uniref:hypothetical protein n=1 Tax=Alcaligenes sp. SORT26 TaxID=2813780 RepID=UPI001FAF79C9|nr:hypothetical protein [Alcaligenes sp. SORT26]
MVVLLLWMLLAFGLAAMVVLVGITLEWGGSLPYLAALVLLVPVGFLIASGRAFIRYQRALPEQCLYQRLVSQDAKRCQAMIVAHDELLPGVLQLAYPLLRLSLDVAGSRAFVDVLVQPELFSRFRPGNTVAVLCDPNDPALCAVDREQVALQLRPVSNSYGD